ncbi:TPA: hypothetical protein HA317_03075, partial [Candidatus Woesearchaeota archaeon]|nr:hypothetical protein [Candidatus Woesearchaeota archaeon]
MQMQRLTTKALRSSTGSERRVTHSTPKQQRAYLKRSCGLEGRSSQGHHAHNGHEKQRAVKLETPILDAKAQSSTDNFKNFGFLISFMKIMKAFDKKVGD